uniref:Uncharacterized protein n=1 Tax=Arundo donax TaxID=35708 RepID=A0A0A9E9Q3_ARUDO
MRLHHTKPCLSPPIRRATTKSATSPFRPRPHCTQPRPPLVAVVRHFLRDTWHAARRRCHLLWPCAAATATTHRP